ncbi:F-box protein DOR [Cardamine amara subsp. amara]|uniref:F-box protein DOR n=1 Tax=Cardamine amara subsp. amara TaxID=228776 RepID=A0ABD1BTC1_CARAN
MEIFLRLPAKSIAKCRCVSKLWASLLCLSYFKELFLTRPCENSTHIAANRLTTFPIEGFFDIIGVVRGLVCLIDKQISKGRTKTVPVICNPSTGESLPLPPVKTRRATVRSFFGYDPVDKQFKVLSMTRGKSMAFDEHQILTLGTGKLKWKMIKCCIPHYPEYGIGICINGGLYYRATVQEVPKIISFHVRSESFRIINIDMDMGLLDKTNVLNCGF